MGHPKGIADILPLTSVQRGMLFHVASADSVPGAYVAVISSALEGPLDPDRLKSAMQATLDARDALRAGFVWENVKQPVQVIKEQAVLLWAELDWCDAGDANARLRDLVHREQTRRFDLTTPPLMAVTLIRVTDTSWRLVWTVHHLISDGWSTEVALREVFDRYDGNAGPDPKPPGFKSYLVWLSKQKRLTDPDFWTDQFATLSEPCLLPQEAEEEIGKTQHSQTVELGADLLAQIEDLATRQKVTTDTVLSAAWAVVLRRLLQRDDVVFGTTTAGRPAEIAGISNAVGAFVNTLPVRLKIDPWQSGETLIQRHAQAQLSRRKHEFASLPTVQACAPFPTGTTLFDTLFVNEGIAPDALEFGDIQLRDLRTSQFSSYPLAMLVTPSGSFRTEIYFDPGRLNSQAVETCLTAYRQVLSELSRNPAVRVRDLFRSNSEPVVALPEVECETVVHRFLEQARINPDAPALSDDTGTLSYAELSRHARQIARTLKAAGIGDGDIVPVALPRGSAAIAGFLGVMMTGASYVPLDMAYPKHRISQIFDTVQPRFVVTNAELRTKLPENNAAEILPDQTGTALDATDVQIGKRAYVMFTSGSQNRPKGVEITQAGLALSTAARDVVHGARPDAYLLLSSLAFDSSVAGLYWTLATGGHLVIAPRLAEQDPARLGGLIQQHGVTHTLCLPSLAQALLSAVPKRDLQSLRMLIAAGEALPQALITQCAAALPKCRLVNEYGPTEATVWCTSYDATSHDGSGPVPIGTAIPGTWVGVVDRDDCTLRAGEVGEIVVGGGTVAQGYLNDPDQTNDRFFSIGADGMRAYRTGDLGVADPSGCVTFLGRKDRQVKIRGHRIELSEIEAVARTIAEDVRVAAVAPETNGSRILALALECETDNPLCEQVAQHIKATLPPQYCPGLVQGIVTFPSLPNGKLDETRLMQMLADHTRLQVAGGPPQNDLERRIAGLFAQVLKTDCTSRDANFFDLGGDSLMTLKTSLIAKDRGIRFEPLDLFSFPTVAGLAARVRAEGPQRVKQNRWKVFRVANEGGGKTPVALIHCLMPFFNHVADRLGPDHTVVHLPSHRLPGMPVPFDKTLEDLADDAIATLRDVTPDQPIILCGFSAGCALTLAIAKQLGPDKVAGLMLLDPPYKMIGAEPALQPLLFRTYKRWRYMFRRAKHLRKARHSVPHAKAMVAATDCSEDQRIEAVSLAYGLAINDFFVPRIDSNVQVFLTPGNPSMTRGDVLDTHLTNKAIHRVSTVHSKLLRLPESQARIAECIKSMIPPSPTG